MVIVQGQAGLPDGAKITIDTGEKPDAGAASDKEDAKDEK